jgi:hypothetical protein
MVRFMRQDTATSSTDPPDPEPRVDPDAINDGVAARRGTRRTKPTSCHLGYFAVTLGLGCL